MMRVLGLCVLLLLAPLAMADDRACMIVLDAAGFDACEGASSGPIFDAPLAGQLAVDAESRFQVIKFAGPAPAGSLERIEQTGARVLGYLPFYAYLVEIDPAVRNSLATLDGVVWAGPFRPHWKIDSSLVEMATRGDFPPALPLSVALHRGVDASMLVSSLAALDGVEHYFVSSGPPRDVVVLTVTGQHVESLLPILASFDEVIRVGVRQVMQFHNSQGPWLHQSGEADRMPIFERGIFGCGQLVGVADSGVDFPHCAFADPELGAPPVAVCTEGPNCLPASPDMNQRKIPIYYKWSPDSDPVGDGACPSGPGAGHGTHVAGSVLGNNWANPVDCSDFSTPGGLSDLDGMAPGAKLIAQEMGSALGYLNNLGGNVFHLVSVAHANGARLHNNSWGGSCCFLGLFCLPGCTQPYAELTESADAAAWEFPEMAIFFAAGNDGTCCTAPRSVGAPGNAKSIISVGATQRGTLAENMASFSSRGPVHDNRTKPDIVAQGQGILSVGSNGNAALGSCETCVLSGTSMASPTAAGLGALIREYLERGFYPTGSENPAHGLDDPSGSLVKALLINGAHSMSGTLSGGNAPNQNQGWGRVNLENVLYFEGDDRQLWLIDETEGLQTGDTHAYALSVNAGEPLAITLVWTDFPATVGAAVALVNELRLEVEDPAGNVWTQKLPASGPPNPFADTSTSGYDNRNNVHQVRLDAPEAGLYQIRVLGLNVAMGGRQHYSLVANADLAMADVGPGELVVEPESLDFGEVPIGQTATQSVVVSNAAATGSGNLVLSLILLTGDADFVISGGDCEIDLLIEPQQSCTLELSFSPTDFDAFGNDLRVETGDGQTRIVSMIGDGFFLPPEIFKDRFEEEDEA
ncbi:MAG: S8 family serine peptidase [Wenzhouxiangella sp.]